MNIAASTTRNSTIQSVISISPSLAGTKFRARKGHGVRESRRLIGGLCPKKPRAIHSGMHFGAQYAFFFEVPIHQSMILPLFLFEAS